MAYLNRSCLLSFDPKTALAKQYQGLYLQRRV